MANVPLKDVTMERVRVEEFEESILFFSRVSLSKFSLEAQYFVGIRGIYTEVRKECEWLVFP